MKQAVLIGCLFLYTLHNKKDSNTTFTKEFITHGR
jgi:hypothetical protein